MYSISNNYIQHNDKNKVVTPRNFITKWLFLVLLFISLLNLKQNKPAPCRYCSGPLASGALNCHSANKGHKKYHYSGVLVAQHLLFTSCDRFLTFSLHVLMSMLASRLATGTMINLFPVHYWLILPRSGGRNETFAELNREFAPPPASILAVSLNFPAPPSQRQINKAPTLQRADDLFWTTPLGKGRKAACWSWLLPFCLMCTQTFSP